MWFYIKCGGVTAKNFTLLQTGGTRSWDCQKCVFSFLPNVISPRSTNYSYDSDDTELLFHLNINSLQSKFDELIIKVINCELKSGIIVLTETKSDSSHTNAQFSLPNYKIYRQDRAKGGGGVLTYITSQIPSKKLRVPFVLYLSALWRDNYYAELEKEFNECLTWATMQFYTIIIMGDLNMDKLKVNGREAKLLRDIEEVFELTCLITEPTRNTDTSQTLLGVLLTNQPDLFKNAGVSDIGLSDHCMVYGFLKETVKKHTAAIINCRSFKNLDMEEFKNDLEEAVWFEQNVTGIDKLYDNWYTGLMRMVDKHLPLKRVKARDIDVPYMMGEWKEAIRKKRRYAKKFSQSKTKENMELMKKWRNNATRLRRKAIKNCWNAICEDMNNNPRKFYNTFTPFLRTKPKKGQKYNISQYRRCDTSGPESCGTRIYQLLLFDS